MPELRYGVGRRCPDFGFYMLMAPAPRGQNERWLARHPDIMSPEQIVVTEYEVIERISRISRGGRAVDTA